MFETDNFFHSMFIFKLQPDSNTIYSIFQKPQKQTPQHEATYSDSKQGGLWTRRNKMEILLCMLLNLYQ